jgi:transposase-like protein
MPEWTDDEKAQLRQMMAEGKKLGEIARRLGRPVDAVSSQVRRLRLQEAKANAPTPEPPRPDTGVEVLPEQLRIENANTPPADPVATDHMSAVADIAPATGELVEPLSPAEEQILAHYEQIITQGMKTFVEVGRALLAIRDQHPYREGYTTFEDYCRQRWDLSRPYAYQLMDAYGVVENVSAIADVVPMNEAQARPLASLLPEQQVEVWADVVKTAPKGKVTAQHVKATVNRAKRQTTTPTSAPSTPRAFDAHGIETKLKGLYMDWLRHCEDHTSLERAHAFLNTLSDLAMGRARQLSDA